MEMRQREMEIKQPEMEMKQPEIEMQPLVVNGKWTGLTH